MEKAKTKGGVCRAELCFPWPIGRNGQKSGARRAVNLTGPSAGVFPREKRSRERSQTEAMG